MPGPRIKDQQEQIRVPLWGNEVGRQMNVQASQSRTIQDQFFMNCYPVIGKSFMGDSAPEARIQSRLGWWTPEQNIDATGQITNLTTAYVKAVLNMSQLSDVLVVAYVDGSAFRFCQYRPYNNSITSLGTIAFSGLDIVADCWVHLSELNIGGVPYCGIVISHPTRANASASRGYYIASTGVGGTMSGSVTQITDADYPPNATYSRKVVGPMVQLNNVIYQMTESGWIHGSEPDTTNNSRIDVWNTSGTRAAASYPDKALGLARYKNHLVAFGEETIEFFNDEGLAQPGLPIARMEQGFIKFGTVSQKGYLNVDDTLWFVGKSISGHVTMYRVEGYTPVQVAPPPWSKAIANRPYTCDLQVTTMHSIRHLVTNLYVLGGLWFNDGTLTGDSPTNASHIRGNLCYAIDSNCWWMWASEHDIYGVDNFEKFYLTTMFIEQDTTLRLCFSNAKTTNHPVSATSETYGIHPREAVGYSEGAVGHGYYDGYRRSNATTLDTYRIPVMLSTPWLDFGTSTRKFIRSATIIGEHIKNYSVVTSPWTTFNSQGLTLNIGMSRTDGISDQTTPEIKRSRDLLTYTQDYYRFNNFGASRKCRFWVSINTYVPVRFEGLELNIAQGTH